MLDLPRRLFRDPGSTLGQTDRFRRPYSALADFHLRDVRRHRAKLFEQLVSRPDLHAAELQVPTDQGFRLVDPGFGLQSKDPMLCVCDELLAKQGDGARFRDKAFMQQMLRLADLAQHPELLAFALDPLILRAVADYLGELPILRRISLVKSTPEDGRDRESPGAYSSRSYHRDFDAMQSLKVIVYLSDVVDSRDGPFTLIPKAKSRELAKAVGYSRMRGRDRIEDEAVFRHLDERDEIVLFGPKGTMAMVDSVSLFHYGSRVQRGARLALFITYLPISNFMMSPFKRKPDRHAHLVGPHFSEIQNAVLARS